MNSENLTDARLSMASAAQDALRAFQFTLDALPVAVAVLDQNGVILAVNNYWRRFADVSGMDAPAYGIGTRYLDTQEPPDEIAVATIQRKLRALIAGDGEGFECEYPCHGPDREQWFLMRASPHDHGDRRFLIVTHLDITQRKQAENKLATERNFLRSVVDAVPQPLFVIDKEYHLQPINRVAETAVKSARQSGKVYCYQVHHQRDTPCDCVDHQCPLREVMTSGKPVRMIHKHPAADDQRIVEVSASPLLDSSGNTIAIVESIHDITEEVRAEGRLRSQSKRLQYMALHDPLTDLPNRTLFNDRFVRALNGARRRECAAALLYIDINDFKAINDTHGHIAGDSLLCAVAERLRGCVRKTDTVARLGGDEFAIILEDIGDAPDIQRVASKLNTILSSPYRIGTHSLAASASIGVAIFPGDGKTPDELLKSADHAMYHAKKHANGTLEYASAISA